MKLHHLGPGILLAAISIGASHILLSPEAGARYGFALVWLVLATHLLKYPAFACAPRYVAARGESLLDAYAQAPGPRRWAIWLGLFDMTVQATVLIAALVGLCATFLMAALGGSSVVGWSLGLIAAILALLRWGRYGSLRAINLVLVLGLALGTLCAFLAAGPTASSFLAMLRPRTPAGSLLLISAILGFMPTAIGVSIWQSLWALEQGRLRGAGDASPGQRLALLRRGLFDLRLGYGLSALLAILFMALGALVLQPRGLVPQGPDVALVLARLYTESLGAWMHPVFLALAFCAMFTTCYTMMDGLPRSFVASIRVLGGQPSVGHAPAAASRGYWIFLLAATFGGLAILARVPDPALLVKAVAALSLLLSPVYYALNLWAVTRRIDDPDLRAGRGLIAASLAGIAFMTFTAGLLLWTTFWS